MRTIREILEEKKASILELEKFLYANPEIEMEEYKAEGEVHRASRKRGLRGRKGYRRAADRLRRAQIQRRRAEHRDMRRVRRSARPRPRLRAQPHRRDELRRGGGARRMAHAVGTQGQRLSARHARRGDGRDTRAASICSARPPRRRGAASPECSRPAASKT